MSNQINFVHDLVQMAKAFEELPAVQAELSTARSDINGYLNTIQRLELKLIERANEIDALNARIRTVEVERDHAETMFLETDDRLNAFRRLLAGFQADAATLVKAQEPLPEPEQVKAEPQIEFRGDHGNVDSVSSGPEGSREAGEQQAYAPSSFQPNPVPSVDTGNAGSATSASQHDTAEGVSVPSDPTPALASSSTNAWPGSTPQSEPEVSQSDPTASSPAGNTPTYAFAPTDAAASVPDAPASCAGDDVSEDDVGYHTTAQ